MNLSKRLKTKPVHSYGEVIIGLLALFSLSISFLPACSLQPSPSPTPQPSLFITYLFTAEATYDKIEVNQDKLSYTYFEDLEGRCARWVEQGPCWTQQDLKTIEAHLSASDLGDLITIIQDVKFMQLSNSYGGAASGQRFYPYTLRVKLGAVEKEVVYQSFPDGQPMPQEMKRLIDKLHELVKARIGK
jgi:hypothetical protein